MTHLRTIPGRAVTIVVAALLGALLTALLLQDRPPSAGFTAGRPEATELPGEVLAAGQAGGGTTRQTPMTRQPGGPTAVPRLLSIPRLDLRMPVVSWDVDDRAAMAQCPEADRSRGRSEMMRATTSPRAVASEQGWVAPADPETRPG